MTEQGFQQHVIRVKLEGYTSTRFAGKERM